MKKLINQSIATIGIVIIGLTSCMEKEPTRDEIVKRNVEEYLKPKMNDPESYEFVELRLTDSILYSDNIKFRKESFQQQIKYNSDLLEIIENYKTEFPKLWEDEKKEEAVNLIAEINKNKEIIFKIDLLESELGQKANNVASYTYFFKFRGKNKMGAKVLNEYILQTDHSPEFKVINLADDKGKVFVAPNGFPGYNEMMEKYN